MLQAIRTRTSRQNQHRVVFLQLLQSKYWLKAVLSLVLRIQRRLMLKWNRLKKLRNFRNFKVQSMCRVA